MEKYNLTTTEERFRTHRMQAVTVCYENEDGSKKIVHTIIKSNPSVAVIVFNDNNEVALIKQFRTTTGKWYYEIPAGVLNDDERIIEAALREVQEETGLIIEEACLVTQCSNLLDPSKSNEDYNVVVAHAIGITNRSLDENEQISEKIEWIKLEEVYSRIKRSMVTGKPFKDGLEMSGHSLYAFLAYKFVNE